MYEFHRDHQKYLYHYTSSETAIDYILKDKTLQFSSLEKTNDPKESKEWFFIPGSNENRDLTSYTPEYLSTQMNPYLKGMTHLLCFTKDKVLKGNHLDDMPKRGFCRSRMWAQYADKHKGVCLVFDTEIISKIIQEEFSHITYKADHVSYRDRLIAEIQTEPAYIANIDCLEDWGADEYAFLHGQKYADRMFFEKAKDWEGEDEYRWVMFDSHEIIKFQYRNGLKGIVFGADCDDDNILKMINLCKGNPLNYQQLKWRNCTPWFNYQRIWV